MSGRARGDLFCRLFFIPGVLQIATIVVWASVLRHSIFITIALLEWSFIETPLIHKVILYFFGFTSLVIQGLLLCISPVGFLPPDDEVPKLKFRPSSTSYQIGSLHSILLVYLKTVSQSWPEFQILASVFIILGEVLLIRLSIYFYYRNVPELMTDEEYFTENGNQNNFETWCLLFWMMTLKQSRREIREYLDRDFLKEASLQTQDVEDVPVVRVHASLPHEYLHF